MASTDVFAPLARISVVPPKRCLPHHVPSPINFVLSRLCRRKLSTQSRRKLLGQAPRHCTRRHASSVGRHTLARFNSKPSPDARLQATTDFPGSHIGSEPSWQGISKIGNLSPFSQLLTEINIKEGHYLCPCMCAYDKTRQEKATTFQNSSRGREDSAGRTQGTVFPVLRFGYHSGRNYQIEPQRLLTFACREPRTPHPNKAGSTPANGI